MNKIVLALILLSVAGCAREPTIYYGRDGGRIGYNGIDFDQAYAECQYSATQTINSGFGDPFYRALSGGQMLMDSCLRSKGFAPAKG